MRPLLDDTDTTRQRRGFVDLIGTAMIIQVIICSEHDFGYQLQLAEAVADGARSIEGSSVELFLASEINRDGIPDARETREVDRASASIRIPFIDATALARADAIIFVDASESGTLTPQMRSLLEPTGPLSTDRALFGKIASVFTSTAPQQGGKEPPRSSFYDTLLRLGMIIVGVPYGEGRILPMEAISGRSSYGASAKGGSSGVHRPTEIEIGIARFQGQYVAEMAHVLIRGRAHTSL